jgi:hypothetical protein
MLFIMLYTAHLCVVQVAQQVQHTLLRDLGAWQQHARQGACSKACEVRGVSLPGPAWNQRRQGQA